MGRKTHGRWTKKGYRAGLSESYESLRTILPWWVGEKEEELVGGEGGRDGSWTGVLSVLLGSDMLLVV